jgi:hypothetical protein
MRMPLAGTAVLLTCLNNNFEIILRKFLDVRSGTEY